MLALPDHTQNFPRPVAVIPPSTQPAAAGGKRPSLREQLASQVKALQPRNSATADPNLPLAANPAERASVTEAIATPEKTSGQRTKLAAALKKRQPRHVPGAPRPSLPPPLTPQPDNAHTAALTVERKTSSPSEEPSKIRFGSEVECDDGTTFSFKDYSFKHALQCDRDNAHVQINEELKDGYVPDYYTPRTKKQNQIRIKHEVVHRLKMLEALHDFHMRKFDTPEKEIEFLNGVLAQIEEAHPEKSAFIEQLRKILKAPEEEFIYISSEDRKNGANIAIVRKQLKKLINELLKPKTSHNIGHMLEDWKKEYDTPNLLLKPPVAPSASSKSVRFSEQPDDKIEPDVFLEETNEGTSHQILSAPLSVTDVRVDDQRLKALVIPATPQPTPTPHAHTVSRYVATSTSLEGGFIRDEGYFVDPFKIIGVIALISGIFMKIFSHKAPWNTFRHVHTSTFPVF